jgi:hypothetical protein
VTGEEEQAGSSFQAGKRRPAAGGKVLPSGEDETGGEQLPGGEDRRRDRRPAGKSTFPPTATSGDGGPVGSSRSGAGGEELERRGRANVGQVALSLPLIL